MHTESLSRPLRLRWTERGAGWLAGAALILAVLAPLLTLGWWALGGDLAHWQHLASYVLPQALANTLILLAGVGALVALLGTGSAWLVTAYEFPARRTWALLLPLAVPTTSSPSPTWTCCIPSAPSRPACAPSWATTARASSACPTCARSGRDLRAGLRAVSLCVPEHARDVHDAGRQPAGSRAASAPAAPACSSGWRCRWRVRPSWSA